MGDNSTNLYDMEMKDLTPELREKFEQIMLSTPHKTDYDYEISLMHAAYILCSEKDNWVSVDDRLPENRTWVLIGNDKHISISEFKHGCFFDENMNRVLEITHWKPLPSPPQSK